MTGFFSRSLPQLESVQLPPDVTADVILHPPPTPPCAAPASAAAAAQQRPLPGAPRNLNCRGVRRALPPLGKAKNATQFPTAMWSSFLDRVSSFCASPAFDLDPSPCVSQQLEPQNTNFYDGRTEFDDHNRDLRANPNARGRAEHKKYLEWNELRFHLCPKHLHERPSRGTPGQGQRRPVPQQPPTGCPHPAPERPQAPPNSLPRHRRKAALCLRAKLPDVHRPLPPAARGSAPASLCVATSLLAALPEAQQAVT
ncbi:uncharacterized protein [Castor canadensis]|uniref:Uncharacterized protein n=1 Tax=Castor canadensis TaxID=51338 RepID=A0AC58K204_CASCN